MFYDLLTNTKDKIKKRESDFSYFHCGPFEPAANHGETPLVLKTLSK